MQSFWRFAEIDKLIDSLEDTRARWKAAEEKYLAAQEHAEHMEKERKWASLLLKFFRKSALEHFCSAIADELKETQKRERDLQANLLVESNARETQMNDYEQQIQTLRVAIEQNLKDSASYEPMLNLSRQGRPLPQDSAQQHPPNMRTSRHSQTLGVTIDAKSARNNDDDVVFLDDDDEDIVELRFVYC